MKMPLTNALEEYTSSGAEGNATERGDLGAQDGLGCGSAHVG